MNDLSSFSAVSCARKNAPRTQHKALSRWKSSTGCVLFDRGRNNQSKCGWKSNGFIDLTGGVRSLLAIFRTGRKRYAVYNRVLLSRGSTTFSPHEWAPIHAFHYLSEWETGRRISVHQVRSWTFFSYQVSASTSLKMISWNEVARRFRFQRATNHDTECRLGNVQVDTGAR